MADTVPTDPDVADAADDTVAADASRSSPRTKIRPSRPTLKALPDYTELQVVDPTHYAIMREIARGGMGRIQVARDRRLGRDVAVKEMLSQSSIATMRFEREARITAKLQHPSIVGVYEAGVWPSGDPFYAMELVSGRSLDEVIAGATSFEQRLALLPNVLAVADAMAYAHGQNVIHRDLKPKNIVVGEFGETVVIDWGLAKELGSASLGGDAASGESAATSGAHSPDNSDATTAGEVLGTPAYMPPEQAADGSGVDARADVYAIGAMLYHVLAGVPPYAGQTAAEVIATLHSVSPAAIAEVAPTASSELVAIVERAMARDPVDRYATARELAEDLRRFQTGQLVGAHRYSLRQLLGRWLRRHRTAIIATAAAAVVAIAVGVIAIVRIVEANHEAEQQRLRAVANEASSDDLLAFMLGDLQRKLVEVGRLDVLDSVSRKAVAYYDARVASGEGVTDDEIFKAAMAHGRIAIVFHSSNDAAARAEFEKQRVALEPLARRRPDVARYAAELAMNRLHVVDLEVERGERKQAMVDTRRIVDDLQPALLLHPAEGSLRHAAYYAKADLADMLERLGDTKAALAMQRESLEEASRNGDLLVREVDEISAHSAIARILRELHDYPGALAEYRLALDIGMRGLARDPHNAKYMHHAADSYREVGMVLADQDKLDEALAQERAGLELAKQLVAQDPLSTNYKQTLSYIEDELGIILFAQKDYAGALAAYRQSYDVNVTLAAAAPTNTDHQRNVSVDLNKLGDIELASDNVTGAIADYRGALAIREKLVAKDPSNGSWQRDLFYSHYLIANALSKRPEQRAETIAELRVALEIAEQRAARATTNRAAMDDVIGVRQAIAETLIEGHDTKAGLAEYRAARELAVQEAARPGANPEWAQWVGKLDAKIAAVTAGPSRRAGSAR